MDHGDRDGRNEDRQRRSRHQATAETDGGDSTDQGDEDSDVEDMRS